MEELLFGIARLSPVIALLVYAVIWLNKLLTKKDTTIELLNAEIKESSNENLTLLYRVLGFFEQLNDKSITQHESVLSEIKAMRDAIEGKLNKE